MFNPGRLELARRRKRLTKKALAEAIGVTAHTVLRYESGDILPPTQAIERMSEVLGFSVSFFGAIDLDPVVADAASFRSMTSMTAAEREAALASGSFAYALADWVADKFDLPASELLDLSGERPEVAARSLREYWALGERPTGNMVHLLESKGARVFSMAENTRTVDAFSVWRGDCPFVFLNTFKTAEHARFDAAHELGHLVLHRHGGPKGRKAEDEANQFASSFLMPAGDVIAQAGRVSTLNQVIALKQRWAVSAMALIYRLKTLKLISDWQYRTFCIQATEMGYRKREPLGGVRERSSVWHQVLKALWRERITREDIARELHLPVGEIQNLLFGLTGGEEQQQGTDSKLRVVR